MDVKNFSHVEIKSADQGLVTAVFSTFNVLDSDGDITLPGAFTEGAEAPISAYGHTSWGGALPVGKAGIRTTTKEAIIEGQFFMDTAHGRDAFLTVKALGQLGQWSYGYRVLDASFGELDGQDVRYLKSLGVDEISPVLVGAGVNTRTLATKGRSPSNPGGAPVGVEYKAAAAIKPHDTAIASGPWDVHAAVKGIASDASVSDLRSVFAWVDPEGDPEMKSSYRFAHHSGVGGPASVRACIKHIAALNGARGGASIPDADRQGVYNHLAAHLRDADREPPELRSSSSADGMKFNDELSVVLSDLDSLIDRASEVVALRAKKGRSPLSLGSSELMDWLDDDMKRLKFLLTPTEDEAAHEYLRFIRHTLGEQTS